MSKIQTHSLYYNTGKAEFHNFQETKTSNFWGIFAWKLIEKIHLFCWSTNGLFIFYFNSIAFSGCRLASPTPACQYKTNGTCYSRNQVTAALFKHSLRTHCRPFMLFVDGTVYSRALPTHLSWRRSQFHLAHIRGIIICFKDTEIFRRSDNISTFFWLHSSEILLFRIDCFNSIGHETNSLQQQQIFKSTIHCIA